MKIRSLNDFEVAILAEALRRMQGERVYLPNYQGRVTESNISTMLNMVENRELLWIEHNL